MNDIIVREVGIEEVMKVHKNVLEFDASNSKKEYFEDRYKNVEKLIIVAYYKDLPIGYIVSYDRFNDGKSFYCWMAGVDNNYRRMGSLKCLMDYQDNWAKEKGYNCIKIKTRNSRREMLSFLIKNKFNLISVEEKESVMDNRINLEKNI